MRVSLIRKLWKEQVQIPALQKQVDKTLRQIDVKLNNKRSKTHDSVSCSCDRYNDCRQYAAGNFLNGLDYSACVSAALAELADSAENFKFRMGYEY